MPITRLLPNIVTASGMGFAALALLWIPKSLPTAFVLWLLAVACDQLDGPLARKFNASSATGAALDAAADVVTHLCFPMMLCAAAGGWWALSGAIAWLIGGGVRLAKGVASGDKDIFLGTPSLLLVVGCTALDASPSVPVAAAGWLVAVLQVSPIRLRRGTVLHLLLFVAAVVSFGLNLYRVFGKTF